MAKKPWSEPDKESKISNVEWGLVIGLLGLVDLIQIGLNLALQVGVIIDRFVDVFVAATLPLYFYLRGVSLNEKRVFGIILAFFFEEIPEVDSLPFWFADGIYSMLTVKAEEKLKEVAGKIPGGAEALERAETAAGAAGGGEETPAGEAETAGAGGEAPAAESEGVMSDEYADAMGQESDERQENSLEEPPESAAGEGELGDEPHDVADEEADELGKQSDGATGEESDKKTGAAGENQKAERPYGRAARPSFFSGSRAGGARGGAQRSPNRLDLRGENPRGGTGKNITILPGLQRITDPENTLDLKGGADRPPNIIPFGSQNDSRGAPRKAA